MKYFDDDGEELSREDVESSWARDRMMAGFVTDAPQREVIRPGMCTTPRSRMTGGWWFPRAFILGYSADGDGAFCIYLGPGWIAIGGQP